MKRAYKYRFYPTDDQVQVLAQTFGATRYVYNRALAERSRAYTQEQKKITYADSARWVAQWRGSDDTPWLADVASVPLQQAVRQLQAAYLKQETSGANQNPLDLSVGSFNRSFGWQLREHLLASRSEPIKIPNKVDFGLPISNWPLAKRLTRAPLRRGSSAVGGWLTAGFFGKRDYVQLTAMHYIPRCRTGRQRGM